MGALAAACGGSSDSSDSTTATTAPATPVNFSERGPYPVGRTILQLPDRQSLIRHRADLPLIIRIDPLTTHFPIHPLDPVK